MRGLAGGVGNGVRKERRGGRIGERDCGQTNAFANIWCARVSDFCFMFWSLAHMSSHYFALQHCTASVVCFYHFKTILILSFSDQPCVHAYVWVFRTSSFWTHLVSGVFEAYPVLGHFGSILYIVTLGLS